MTAMIEIVEGDGRVSRERVKRALLKFNAGAGRDVITTGRRV